MGGKEDKDRDAAEFIASGAFHRTKKATLWRALVISCWEVEEMNEKMKAFRHGNASIKNRLALASYAVRYWGELAVRKELQEGWPPEP